MKKEEVQPNEVPGGYVEFSEVDVRKNKKLSIVLNVTAIIVSFIMLYLGLKFFGLEDGFRTVRSIRQLVFEYGILFALSSVYIVLHELTHGLFIRIFSGRRPTYGFTGIYACAGSSFCFDKVRYSVIALAPAVVWGIVFGVISLLMPPEYFWLVYMLQIVNISGAVGDYYVVLKMTAYPAGTIVRDTGTAFKAYAPVGSEQ